MKLKQFFLIIFLLFQELLISQELLPSNIHKQTIISGLSTLFNNQIVKIVDNNETLGIITSNEFKIIDNATKSIIMEITFVTPIYDLISSNSGKYLILHTNSDGTFHGEIFSQSGLLISEISQIMTQYIDFSPEGDYIYSYSPLLVNSNKFEMYNTNTGDKVKLPFSIEYPLFTASFIDNENLVIVFRESKRKYKNSLNRMKKEKGRDYDNAQRIEEFKEEIRINRNFDVEILPSVFMIYDVVSQRVSSKKLINQNGEVLWFGGTEGKKIFSRNDKIYLLAHQKPLNQVSEHLYPGFFILNKNGEVIDNKLFGFVDCTNCGIRNFVEIDDKKLLIFYNDAVQSGVFEWTIDQDEIKTVYQFPKKYSNWIKTAFETKDKSHICIQFEGSSNISSSPLLFEVKTQKVIYEFENSIIVESPNKKLLLRKDRNELITLE